VASHKATRSALRPSIHEIVGRPSHESTPSHRSEEPLESAVLPPSFPAGTPATVVSPTIEPDQNRLRVWEVTPYGLRAVSGITTLVRDLSRRLEEHGCHVTVITPEASEGGWPDGFGVISLCVRGPFRNGALAWKTAATLWKHRRHWDVLHLHQGHLMTCFAAIVARVLARPAVVTFHVQLPPGIGLRSYPTRVATYLVGRFAVKRVFVSERTRLDFQLEGRVIRNGIDVAQVQSALGSRVDLRSKLGLSGFVVAFSGRKARNKGYMDLLRAVRRVRDLGFDVRLLALGPIDPTEAEEISALVDENALRPFIADVGKRSDCIAFLSAADAIALPSYREGFPMSLLEGMAAGLPVIASAVGGIPELVTEGHDGFVVPPGNIEALSQAIRRLAENPALTQRLALAARVTAQTHDSKATAASYLEVFAEARGVERKASDDASADGSCT